MHDDARVGHVQLSIMPVDPTGAMKKVLIGLTQQIEEIDHGHIFVENTLKKENNHITEKRYILHNSGACKKHNEK